MASWRAWQVWICGIDKLGDSRAAAGSHSERHGLDGGLMPVDGPDDVVLGGVVPGESGISLRTRELINDNAG